MNRVQLIRYFLTTRALADAARELLDNEAAAEWTENETQVNWKTPEGVSVAANVSNRTLAVVDDQMFFLWLSEEYPSEVITVLRVRNQEWLKARRDEMAALVATGKMDAPPGTKLDEGGTYSHIALTGATAIKKQLHALAVGALTSGTAIKPEDLDGAAIKPEDLWEMALDRAFSITD